MDAGPIPLELTVELRYSYRLALQTISCAIPPPPGPLGSSEFRAAGGGPSPPCRPRARRPRAPPCPSPCP
eukprot:9530149-Heterocapsa_arctica.AAC.1